MLADPHAERARRRIARLCRSGLDSPALLRAVAEEVRPIVAYDGAAWATTDPSTLLVTGAFVQELPRESAPAFYENEYLHDDVLKFSRLARGVRPVATLSEATGGDLSRSRLYRELAPLFGFRGDALRAALVSGRSCWGAVALARRDPRAHFTQVDVSFVASVGALVGEGLRAAMLLRALAPEPSGVAATPEPPGLVILDGARVRSASASAEAWLEELGPDAAGAAGGRMHSALLAVAGAVGADGADGEPAAAARTVLRTSAGRWLSLQGVRMRSLSGGSEVAIILDGARPPELAAAVMTAYGLSPRESAVAQRVIAGATTHEVAAALHISPWTVQDHLKSVFRKVGVRSRGELTKQVFDGHYAAQAPLA